MGIACFQVEAFVRTCSEYSWFSDQLWSCFLCLSSHWERTITKQWCSQQHNQLTYNSENIIMYCESFICCITCIAVLLLRDMHFAVLTCSPYFTFIWVTGQLWNLGQKIGCNNFLFCYLIEYANNSFRAKNFSNTVLVHGLQWQYAVLTTYGNWKWY